MYVCVETGEGEPYFPRNITTNDLNGLKRSEENYTEFTFLCRQRNLN